MVLMSSDPRLFLILTQAAATLVMVGAIWIVQLVHYPLFAFADPATFPDMAARHQRAISFVVVPAMLVELGGAIAWLVWRPPAIPLWSTVVGLALVVAVWLVTFLVQVPQHEILLGGYDTTVIAALVAGNWWRTALWSTRGVLVIWWLGLATNVP